MGQGPCELAAGHDKYSTRSSNPETRREFDLRIERESQQTQISRKHVPRDGRCISWRSREEGDLTIRTGSLIFFLPVWHVIESTRLLPICDGESVTGLQWLVHVPLTMQSVVFDHLDFYVRSDTAQNRQTSREKGN